MRKPPTIYVKTIILAVLIFAGISCIEPKIPTAITKVYTESSRGLTGCFSAGTNAQTVKKAPISETNEYKYVFTPGQVIDITPGHYAETTSYEVNFTRDHPYTVVMEKDVQRHARQLKVYQGAALIFTGPLSTGGIGERLFLTGARGEGRVDLVILGTMGAGYNVGGLVDLRIIGDNGDAIGLLPWKDENILGYYTWPQLIDTADRIVLEYSPVKRWTRYRRDIRWDPGEKTFVLTEPVRSSPPVEIPAADKTVFFSFGPGNEKTRCLAGGAVVDEVHIRVGEKLLLRHDPDMDEELAVLMVFTLPDKRPDASVVKIDNISGNYLLTARKPGVIKMGLGYGYTTQNFRVIIDDPAK